MKTISKFVSVVVAAIFPAIASASVDTLSFTCTSSLVVSQENDYQASCDGDFSFDSGKLFDVTSISLAAKGQLNIGEQAMLTAPDIRLFANNVNVYGSLSAPGGIIEINSPNSVVFGVTAKLDIKSASLPVFGYSDFYEPKLSMPYAGSISLNSGADITSGSFNSSIGLLTGMQGGAIEIEAPSFLGVYSGSPAIPLSAVSQVPEPSNLSMLAMGLVGIGLVVRRKAKKN